MVQLQIENTDGSIANLIGTHAMAEVIGPAHAFAGDLMAALHAGYCRALDDPRASLEGDWNPPAASSQPALAMPPSASPPPPDSIEAMLSGAQIMEHVFADLEGTTSPVWTAAPAPDILRLFAPPEFSAQPAWLPPSLVRRDHHATGVDSPLLLPDVTIPLRSTSERTAEAGAPEPQHAAR